MKKTVQVKDIQLSQLQGEHCIQANVHAQFNLEAHTDELQTVTKVLQAKDTEIQAKEKLTKSSEGEAFCEDPFMLVQVYTFNNLTDILTYLRLS